MHHLITVLPIAIIILAVLFLRTRRTITVQPVRLPIMISRMIMLVAIGTLVAGGVVPNILTLIGIATGILVGIGGAFLSLHYTLWDTTESEVHYKANPYIGSIVVALVVIRIVLSLGTVPTSGSPVLVTQSPLTLALYYLFVSYWMVYYMGVVQHARAIAPRTRRG